jgi:cell division protein FtsL
MLAAWRNRRQVDEEAGEPPARLYHASELARPGLLLLGMVALVVLSSLAVIVSAHEYRKLFHLYQTAVNERDELQVEWGQLLLEQGAWAANNRVEALAKKKLAMSVPGESSIEFVRYE